MINKLITLINISQRVKAEEINLFNHACKAPYVAPIVEHVFKYRKIEMSM